MAKTVNLTAVEKLSTYNEHTNLIVEQEGELNRVAIADLKISSSEIYKQDEEPIDAPEGALWIDTDESSASGGDNGVSQEYVTEQINTAIDSLSQKVDTDINNAMDEVISHINGTFPTVTTEDNGKFLRVVDGKWAAVSVPYAEEASF